MKKYYLIIMKILCIFLCLLFSQPSYSEVKNSSENDFILVITSYNPDTRRMANFLNSFENALQESGHQEKILIENMGYRGISNIADWKQEMSETLKRYNKESLASIILLGQEAWCTFLNQDTLYSDIPFYGCFVSENVIELPTSPTNKEWEPKCFQSQQRSRNLSNGGGGYINQYDIDNNIKLIRRFYPSIARIAFLSDNSYGGIALQSHVKKEMKEKHPDMELILLDSRKDNVQTIKEKIADLPPNTAILIGTWRIDCNGLYFSKNTLEDIFPEHGCSPIFSLTGLGIGSVAIGGFIPDYDIDANRIAKDINRFNHRQQDTASFFITSNQYVFDRINLKKFGIRDYQVPPSSIIQNRLENTIQKYQDYIFIAFTITLVLTILSLRLAFTKRQLRLNQQELICSRDKAERSEKLKSAFLANMSHEIRTPLNAIVGFSELLIESDDPEDKKQFGQLILQNNDILLNLINDLLDLSKIEAGYIEFNPIEVDLNNFFTDLYAMFSLRVNPRVELSCEIPDNRRIIIMDPKKLQQILNNYLSNAAKFTQKGSIRFGYKIQDNGVYFYVSDTGIGISEKNKKNVFARFQKLDSYAQGTGLGLSICKAIADAAHGKVGFNSEKGKGSTFWAWLPCEFQTKEKLNINA